METTTYRSRGFWFCFLALVGKGSAAREEVWTPRGHLLCEYFKMATKFGAKKRPKVFLGTRSKGSPAVPPGRPHSSGGVGEPVERPYPLETASSKKLAISPACPSTSEPSGGSTRRSARLHTTAGEPEPDGCGEMKGYRLVSCESLSQAVGKMGVCSECFSPLTVREDLSTRRGLVSKLAICCTNTECGREAKVSDPYSSETKSLNTRSILAMREIGRGRSYLESFCGVMDMLPPVVSSSYMEHNQVLADASYKAAVDNMNAASAHLHRLKGVDPHDILDVRVTCDGTWSRRGFSAIHGVVAVISHDTGQVLDFQIMTKTCTACAQQKTRLSPEDFDVWVEGHMESGSCSANHDGSSPSMECDGALIIWKRSEEARRLRYTEVISDGDSKTIVTLNESEPYGSGVTIIKHECVAHVGKRVEKRGRATKKDVNAHNKAPRAEVKQLKETLKGHQEFLREAKAEVRAEAEARGWGRGRGRGGGVGRGRGRGRGRRVEVDDEEVEMDEGCPTDAEVKVVAAELEIAEVKEKIEAVQAGMLKGVMLDTSLDRLQSLYSKAIREHPGDLEGMRKACWAVYYHYVSTDQDPQHHHCPDGVDSWCLYQKALARGQEIPPTNTLIPGDYAARMKAVWEDLCADSLLNRCLLGATQNRNESFNSLVWSRCSKVDFSGRNSVQIATSLAVLAFNSGKKAMVGFMESLGIEPGPLCNAYFESRDRTRLQQACYVGSAGLKQRRISKRRGEKQREEEHVAAEGDTYAAGGH